MFRIETLHWFDGVDIFTNRTVVLKKSIVNGVFPVRPHTEHCLSRKEFLFFRGVFCLVWLIHSFLVFHSSVNFSLSVMMTLYRNLYIWPLIVLWQATKPEEIKERWKLLFWLICEKFTSLISGLLYRLKVATSIVHTIIWSIGADFHDKLV